MAINLEGLIIFALILNMLGFVVYALSMYTKKEVGTKKPKIKVVETPEEEASNPSIEVEQLTETPVEAYGPKVLPDEETEVDRVASELKEMHNKQPEIKETSNVGLSVEEIYGLDKEDEADQLAKELREIQDEGHVVEQKVEAPVEVEQGYGVMFEEEIKEEVKEAKELTDVEESNSAKKNEIRYSIDEQENNIETEKETKEASTVYQEPKREIIDAVNILDIEGTDEDEEEGSQDEFVVRHYEPLAYAKENEEVVAKEEEDEDEDEAIKRRIAYLTGEWTDDYIIQPKNKK